MAQWMRVLDTLSGLAQMAGRFRKPAAVEDASGLPAATGGGALGTLEARLAGVVVAALKEAFDRDSARLELERAQVDAERKRADAALRAELRRQASERALGQLRLIAIMAIGTWALSAALGVWLPGMRAGIPRTLLGTGWFLMVGALACAFAGSQRVAAWSVDADGTSSSSSSSGSPATGGPQHAAALAAPWLLIGAVALTAASLLTAL